MNREMDDRIIAALELANIGFYRYKFDGTVISADQMTFDFFELEGVFKDPESLIGRNIAELFTYIGPEGKLRSQIRDKSKANGLEYGLKTLGGREKWGVHNSYLVVDEETGEESIQVCFYDITELKLAHREAERQKERLLVTLRSIGDGVITADLEGRVVLLNSVAENLTGWSQGEAAGRPLEEVFNIVNAGTGQKSENPVEKVYREKRIISIANHTTLTSRDGTKRMIADSGAPIRDEDGEITGAVLVFRDVTEKYHIEEQLRKKEKLEALGVLAGGIAHDFNNISAVITGNASYALSKVDRGSELYDVLTDIQRGARNAQNLTTQLLTFSKGGSPVRTVADLNEIIEESTKFILRGTRARCECELSEDLWACEVDKGQLSQVICNLALNACQAMPEGGTILVRTSNLEIEKDGEKTLPAGKYVEISLKDEGAGIPSENIDKIFDPFYTTKQKGSGLGLATSYSIVKNHSGHIEVRSELGSGTEFHIYLPAVDGLSGTGLASGEHGEVEHSGKGSVLVMDDQDMVLKMAGRLLESMGYDVVLVAEGSEAVEEYRKARAAGSTFDLVILDLTVPGGMGGKETVAELQKIDPDVKAVVSSGFARDPIMSRYRDYGFCGVVPKPYTLDQLAEVLNDVLTAEN